MTYTDHKMDAVQDTIACPKCGQDMEPHLIETKNKLLEHAAYRAVLKKYLLKYADDFGLESLNDLLRELIDDIEFVESCKKTG